MADDLQIVVELLMKESPQNKEALDAVTEKIIAQLNLTGEAAQELRAKAGQIWADYESNAGKAFKAAEKAQEESLRRMLRAQEAYWRNQSQFAMRASQRVGRAGTFLLGAGVAITGGMFAEANRYAQAAKSATKETKEWNSAIATLADSRTRIDKSLVTAVLPLLKQVADYADKIGRFAEANPQIAKATLTAGAVLVGLGAITKLAAGGLKMYADYAWLTAESLNTAALDRNTAAQLGKSGAVAGIVGKGLLAGAGVVGGSLVSALAGVALGIWGYDKLQKAGLTRKGSATVPQIATVSAAVVGSVIASTSTGLGLTTYDEARDKTLGFTKAVGVLTGAMGTVEDKAKLLSGVLKILGFNMASNAGKIGSRSMGGSMLSGATNLTYGKGKVGLESTYNQLKGLQRERDQIGADYASNVTNIMTQFRRGELEAEANYRDQRSQIVRDGGIEIVRIEEDNQKALAKLAKEHGRRMDELAAQRDALGLVKEIRNYNDQVDEQNEQTNTEIKRRREDIALRLQDLDAGYRRERAQRLAQLNDSLRIARAEYEARHKANEAMLKDLYLFINGITTTTAQMTAYMNAWMKAMAAGMAAAMEATGNYAGGVRTPGGSLRRAFGGYASYGNYTLGDNPFGGSGPREFVMNGGSVRAAEGFLGSALTQQNVLAAIAQGGGRSVNYQDNRRFDSEIPATTRRQIARETVELIVKELR